MGSEDDLLTLRKLSWLAATACLSTLSACSFWDMDSWTEPTLVDGASPNNDKQDASALSDATTESDGSAGQDDATSSADSASDSGHVAVDAAGMPAYAVQVLQDAPLGYWRLDETSGTIAADSSGNGNNGTISGSIGLSAAGAITDGTAATFSGGSIDIGNKFPFLANASFSIEAWVKASTVDGLYRRIAGKESLMSAPPRQGYNVWIHDDAVASWGLERLSAGSNKSVSASSLPLNVFSHVVATYNGATLSLYVNGSLANSGSLGEPLFDHTGRFRWGASDYANAAFLGAMDELAVYGSALSAARVQAHYNAGKGP